MLSEKVKSIIRLILQIISAFLAIGVVQVPFLEDLMDALTYGLENADAVETSLRMLIGFATGFISFFFDPAKEQGKTVIFSARRFSDREEGRVARMKNAA